MNNFKRYGSRFVTSVCRNLAKYDKEKFILANLFASCSPQYLISDFIFFLIFKILFLRLFFLSAELNIFEKDQQFKDYLRDYETLHCARYVAYHGTKESKENGMLDLTLVFHTAILLHYFTFFIPNGCMDRREET